MTESSPDVPAEGGIVAEVAHMTEAERSEHFDEVAEVVAPERQIAVEVGQTLLEVEDVTLRFGGLVALDSVSFDIKRGEILGLIGPNGAGKTTCFNVMTGVYRPTSGQVLLEGAPLGRRKRYQITKLGLARTFQNIRLFGEMTALENVVVGVDARHMTGVLGALVRSPRHHREEREVVAPDRQIGVEIGQTLLEVRNVTLRFGGLVALDSVSFQIKRGEILGLIGPNGAGKTTCFNVMTGVYRPTSGQVLLEGGPLGRRKRYEITQLGLARTFQNIRLFSEMTALENVVVGVDARHKTGVLGALVRSPRHHKEEREVVEKASALLEFVGIADRAADKARNLPYGYQRRLEIARALATEPKLLCLDEPAAGFNPAEKEELMGLIRKIRDDGYTVLLIEHDMRLVMGVTDRIVVLEFGKKIADGLPAEIRDNPAVVAAYLGVPDDGVA
ncbi:MAG TPA: ATP-binding cassette domain-containing protein [Pseudonocardiaceae bacterium]